MLSNIRKLDMVNEQAIGYGVVGNKSSPDWLETNALLNLFAKNRKKAISKYIEFVHDEVDCVIW